MNAIIISALMGVVMMFCSAFLKNLKSFLPVAIVGFLILLAVSILDFKGVVLFRVNIGHMLEFSKFSLLISIVLTVCGIFYLLLSGAEIEKVGSSKAEYFALLFFIYCGIYIVLSFSNLLMLFIGIEIISIPLYILASSDKRNLKSNEAGIKYFLMGAFSTGVLLLGIAFLYGSLGTFSLTQMNLEEMRSHTLLGVEFIIPNSWTVIGMMLLFAAMAFKVSVAPFHFWTPDVYDGSPTVFTSLMATIVKAAVFIAFIKLFHELFGVLQYKWEQFAAIATALTLIIGNITAVFQQSVKRMLAYSSIAQAGFMMFAVMVVQERAYEAILLYTVAYSLATMGIFAVLLNMKDYTFEGFNGLGKSHPVVAGATTVFLLSLAGIPLTAGFFAKYYMLLAAIQNGVYLWLIILAVLCAAVSVYYYFRVVQAMYFKQGTTVLESVPGARFKLMLLVTAILIILIGIFPNLITDWMY
jgi:NADH-quinone oxidoreductase subunit N